MDAEVQLYASLGYCIFMLLLAYIFQKNPPKKINWWYGYRTRRSMANEKVWKSANTYSSVFMVKVCWYSLLIPAIGYFLFPNYNILVTIAGNTLLIVSTFWFTERYLDRYFDKNGNPK
tara:strand:- start:298 stop:651 length:354 start_codon:yes stop_codon:yes gene_type:complete